MTCPSYIRMTVLFMCMIATGLHAAGEDNVVQTERIFQIETRIQEIEQELLQHQADRFRQKHAVEFADPEAIPLRIESKTMEKELLELRRAHDTRLRIIDDEYRTLQREARESHKRLRDKEMLLRSAQRELAAAMESTGQPEDREVIVNQLRIDIANYEAEIAVIRQTNAELLQGIATRKQGITEKDSEAFALQHQIDELEPRYREMYGLLHQSVDAHEDVVKLDAARQALALELQSLRREKQEALNAVSRP
ncbi:MAG TPA: hypothetical protein PJ991_05120 [Kiritimatiellia bacterium]|nr:hypothetical protein [Kiritimatiellia bacterium]